MIHNLSATQVLKEIFGYQQFQLDQEIIIKAVLEGRDCLVVMPTGSGKSLCYQIPALILGGLTIVISPLISLMKDQVDQLRVNGIAAAYFNSTQTRDQQKTIIVNCYNKQINLLYVTPERLILNNFIKDLVRYCSITLFAIDEAHCISQWGHDFRPEYAMLGQLRKHFLTVPCIALTATADNITRQDIIRLLGLNDPFVRISSFNRPNIRYILLKKNKPLDQLLHYIKKQQDKSGIIYCNSRSKVQDITCYLQHLGFNVAAYHAGLKNCIRISVQEEFQRNNLQIIVATIAFGMGINKPNVRFVIHFDIPCNIESYYQETGRAGRDGYPAEAVLFYDPADIDWLYYCVTEKHFNNLQDIKIHKLYAIGSFAETQICRRLVLLNYFGEKHQKPCNNCDICFNPPKQYDGLMDARKVLSTIYRVNQRFKINYVIKVLCGISNQSIRNMGHDKLTVYGIGKEKSYGYWFGVINQLIHLGFAVQNITQHSVLQLTRAARPILRGEVELQLAIPCVTLKSHIMQKFFYSSYNRKLFIKLRTLRKIIAKKENIPSYIVFNDSTLIEIAERMPLTASEMLDIKGISADKFARFGKKFIILIRSYVNNYKLI